MKLSVKVKIISIIGNMKLSGKMIHTLFWCPAGLNIELFLTFSVLSSFLIYTNGTDAHLQNQFNIVFSIIVFLHLELILKNMTLYKK